MCAVVVSLQPGERFPLRLLGIRDELIGLGPGGLRYDFQPTPGNTGTWYSVTVG